MKQLTLTSHLQEKMLISRTFADVFLITIGTSIVSWNTNDASGKPVATGVYNVRLTVGSDIINRNVVVAR